MLFGMYNWQPLPVHGYHTLIYSVYNYITSTLPYMASHYALCNGKKSRIHAN